MVPENEKPRTQAFARTTLHGSAREDKPNPSVFDRGASENCPSTVRLDLLRFRRLPPESFHTPESDSSNPLTSEPMLTTDVKLRQGKNPSHGFSGKMKGCSLGSYKNMAPIPNRIARAFSSVGIEEMETSGHDFSRADSGLGSGGAAAPEGSLPFHSGKPSKTHLRRSTSLTALSLSKGG